MQKYLTLINLKYASDFRALKMADGTAVNNVSKSIITYRCVSQEFWRL